MKKNSMAIIGVVAFVLAVAVGYALFSETINVNGSASINEDKSINININTDNGEYASYTKNADGFINFSANYREASNMIDYMQNLVKEVVAGIEQ